MQAPTLHPDIGALAECGPLKAWSVIVTILGDLCQSPDDRLAGRALMRLMAAMGVSGQTARVALHRLRRDGWIVSERRGRDAAYGLSPTGWSETQAAKGRIYDPAPAPERPLRLLLAPPGTTAAEFAALLPADAAQITPRTALDPGAAPLAQGLWAVEIAPGPGEVPGWVAEAAVPPGLAQDYARLARAAHGICRRPPPDDPVATSSLRLLTLHHWRRLRLRHGPVPDLLLGGDWPGAAARAAVMEVLRRYPRPALEALTA